MVKCPNINSPQWRQLIEQTDIDKAYSLYMGNGNTLSYTGTPVSNKLKDDLDREFSLKRGEEYREFTAEAKNRLVQEIYNDYTGNFTITHTLTADNKSTIEVTGYPVRKDVELNTELAGNTADSYVLPKQEPTSFINPYQLTLEDGLEIYSRYNLVNEEGKLKTLKKADATKWANSLNKGNSGFYFRLGKTALGYNIIIHEKVTPEYEQRAVDYTLKAVNILQSDKAKQVFDKGNKAGWSLDKILSELQIPKDQKLLLQELNTVDREELALGLVSNYSYTVEIGIAVSRTGRSRIGFNEEIGKYEVNDGFLVMRFDTKTEAIKYRKDLERLENLPADYYKNLTVPGGANYVENEISTPLITPSIKGHAQFATDKGIGWFRSDDMALGTIAPKSIDKFIDVYNTEWEKKDGIWYSTDLENNMPPLMRDDLSDADIIEIHPEKDVFNKYNNTGIATKTRRILELQSDLFQKGRDKSELVNKDYNVQDWFVEDSFGQFDIVDSKTGDRFKTFNTKIEAENFIKKYQSNSKENQFLQLLNKDSNWVAFFIKSIIQDSAKKGYEKVLFPKGETAAKIEGHQTIAEEIIRITEDIKEQQNWVIKLETEPRFMKSDSQGIYWGYIEGEGKGFKTYNEALDYTKSGITNLEQKKADLKSQGIEKLKPIEAFYEIKVGRILEKIYGKQNVQVVTDEFGNQWNEITVDIQRDLRGIELQRGLTPLLDSVNPTKILNTERRKKLDQQKELLLRVFPNVSRIIEDYNLPVLGTLEAGGTIVRINPDSMENDTLFHEFGHLLIDLMGGMSNSIISRTREALIGSKAEERVTDLYPDLVGTEAFDKEVVAQALGLEAEQVWEDQQNRNIWEQLLYEILTTLKNLLGINRSDIKNMAREMTKGKVIDFNTYQSKASKYVQEQRENINNTDQETIVKAFKEISNAIEFDEASHKYFLEGDELTPVSTLMRGAGYGISNTEETPAIVRGQKLGTTIHKNAEAISNGVADIVNADTGFELTKKGHQDLKDVLNNVFGEEYVLLNEVILADAEAKVAGTADVIALDKDNNVYIFDFKTKDASKGFKYYDSTNFGKSQRQINSLQLSLYSRIIKRSLGLDVKSMSIVMINAEVNKFDKIIGISLDTTHSDTGVVELAYNPLAADILREQISKQTKIEPITGEDIDPESIDFKNRQIENESLDKYQRLYQDALDNFRSKLSDARTKNKTGEVSRIEELLDKMVNSAIDPKRGIGLFASDAVTRINRFWTLYKEREAREQNGEQNVWTPSMLVSWHELLSAFDNLEEVSALLLTEGVGLPNSLTEKYRRIIDNTISKKNLLKNLYKEKGGKILAEAYYHNITRVINTERELKKKEWLSNNKATLNSMKKADRISAMNKYAEDYINENYTALLQHTKLKFEQELIKANEDIGFMARWLDTILNSNDMVVAGMAKDFVIQVDKGRQESITMKQDMLDLVKELEKAVGYSEGMPVEKLYDFMLEKGKDGKYTGELLTKFNSKLLVMENQMMQDTKSLPRPERTAKRKEWRAKHGISTNYAKFNYDFIVYAEQLLNDGIISEQELTSLKMDQEKPFYAQSNINSLVNPEAADMLIHWKDINRLSYREVTSDEFANKEWNKLSKILEDANDPRTKFYNFLIDASNKADSYLPTNSRLNGTLPAIRKAFMESIQSGKSVTDSVKDTVKRKTSVLEEDVDRGKFDENNNAPIFFLPTFYTRGTSFDVSEQSYDLATIYFNFYRMAADYRHKNEIIGRMELAKKFINERKYTMRDAKGNPIKKALDNARSKELTKSGQTSLLAAQVEDFFKTQLYKQETKDMGTFEILGLKIDKAKAIEMINSYTAINMLGLNVVQGFANVNLGEMQNITEAVAGEIFDLGDLHKATTLYFNPTNMGEMLADVGSRTPASLVGLLNEKWDILNEYEGGVYRKSSKFAQLMSTNSLFFTSRMGEHFMQSRVMLAMLNKVIARDSEGKELGTMMEMYTTKKGRLVFKDEFKDKIDLERSNWTEEKQTLFGARAKRVLARLHGEYSELGKNAVQRHVLGRTALMFRKFMYPGYDKRYGKVKYNEFIEEYTEGSYRQFGRFFKNIVKDLAQLKFALMQEKYNELLPREQANIRRALTEASFVLSTILLAGLFTVGAANADDDREKWMYSFLTYQAKRTRSELLFFLLPNEAMNILISPAASISMVQNMIDFSAQMFNPFEEYQTGNWKGRTKISKKAMKLTPGIKQWYRLRDIEDYINLFNFN